MTTSDSERRKKKTERKRNKYILTQKQLIDSSSVIGSKSGRTLFAAVGKHLAPTVAETMVEIAESYVRRARVESDNKKTSQYIVDLGVEALIPLVLVGWHTILSCVGAAADVTSSKLGGRIGDACMRELCLTRIKRDHPKEYGDFLKTEAGRKKMRHTWNFFERHFESRYGIPVKQSAESLALKNIFGKIMLLTILRCTDLLEAEFQLRRRGTSVTKPLVIRPSEKMGRYLKDLTEYAADSITSGYGYVTEEPKAWVTPTEGGYSEQGMYLVRGANLNTPMPSKEDCPLVYTALNKLQAVPYIVDEDMFKLMEHVFKSGKTLMGMRDPSKMWVQPMIVGEEWDKMSEDDKKLTGLTRRVHLAKWDTAVSQRANQARVLNEARDIIKSGGRCYFPSSCDFRGRIYQGHSFGPQGSDLSKGMLSFAQKEVVETEESNAPMLNFLLEGARRFGVKGSYHEQGDWVRENQHTLLALGEAVKDGTVFDTAEFDSFWLPELEDCWQALQWCRDYVDVLSGKPVGTICSMDATCHGLQIWSLLLRDEELAEKVNVKFDVGRRDIYSDVARKVKQELIERDSPSSRLVLDAKVTRGLLKPMVMRVPYGLTILPVTEGIHQHLLDSFGLPNTNFFPSARNVSGIFFSACCDELRTAVDGMKWLRKVAHKPATTGVLSWKTPVGFPIYMKRVKYKGKKHDLNCLGIRSSVVTKYPTSEPSPTLIKRPLPANFIHGIDSSLLTMVVAESEIDRLRVIHDSYGCHPNDMEYLYDRVLNTVANLFDTDWLGDFAKQVNPTYTVRPPLVNTLDVDDVLCSQYFLA